jgi:carboxyl-terminal processing protease
MWCLVVALIWSPAVRAEDAVGLDSTLKDIHERFPQEIASDALYRAALEGVARHLGEVMGVDGNRVLTTDESAGQEAWLEGQRNGIGAEFSIVPGRGVVITEVFEQGPASEAGVEVGDLVVSMNDHPFTGQTAPGIHAQVSSCKSKSAVLDVRRSDGSIRRLSVLRGAYRLPPVRTSETKRSVPVARVPFFGKGSSNAIERFLKAQGNAMAVVIDLRDNEGGSLDEVIAAADLFLDPGSIIVNRGRDRSNMEPVTAENAARWSRDVVVLVNRGTTGVAEAFAAALKDNGRGMLVGTRSAGRAVDSSVYPAGRGLVMQVADIHLASPSGLTWSKRGLMPNVVVESTGLSIPLGGMTVPPDLQRDTAIRLISTSQER